jgi:hypothetical protein
MKAYLDETEYDSIEAALISYGQSELTNEEKTNLSRIMRKLRTVHSLAKDGKIFLEPAR